MMDVSADQAERRHAAFEILSGAGGQFEAKEAFVIVRLWKDFETYDAIYHGGPTLVSPKTPHIAM